MLLESKRISSVYRERQEYLPSSLLIGRPKTLRGHEARHARRRIGISLHSPVSDILQSEYRKFFRALYQFPDM